MKKSKNSSLSLREMAENPQNGFEKALSQLPCMQKLLKSLPNNSNSDFLSPNGESTRRGIEVGEVRDTPLSDWLDNQDVMQILHISPRTLQTLRSNGTLPFSRIGNKLFYRRQDIIKILSDNYTMHKIQNYGK